MLGAVLARFSTSHAKRVGNRYGVDPSKSGITFAQGVHQLDVQCGEVFDANFPTAHFDAITLYHVLEHIPELNPFLSELRRVLKPQTGTLVIEVPNGEGLQSRLQKAEWPYVHPHDHLYYFSARSLPKLLRKHGFQEIRLGKPRRVGPTAGIGFALRQAATAALVRFHLGTVIGYMQVSLLRRSRAQLALQEDVRIERLRLAES